MKFFLVILLLDLFWCNISPSKTYKQIHAKKYFNTEYTGKIYGNSTNYLYSGMNVVSIFGDLEKAGNKRITIREKTLEKYEQKWTEYRRKNFQIITEKFKKQARNYKEDLIKPHSFIKGIKTAGRPGSGGKKK
jgi:hypothetical protein